MLKKLILMMFVVMFALCCSGCEVFTADTAELFSPPSLSGDLKPISDAIAKSAGNGYTFKYPQSGEYRSAVVQKDINGDGILEAFAFYSITEDDVVTMNIDVIRNRGGEWISSGSQHIVAGGIDRVDFCDLDEDGVLEILVGWQIYGSSEMQLAVYSFNNNTLIQRLLQRYTHFTTCNLDDNNRNDVLIIDMNTIDVVNTASLYSLSAEGVTQIGSCELDSKTQSIGAPIVSELSSGKPAVYIDSVKGLGAITEVLIFKKGKLLNPLFDEQTKETLSTLRSVSFNTRDFNGDGILEIPVQSNVPAVAKTEVTEKLYLTNWCSFNGEHLTVQTTAMINTLDGYYYTVPSKWLGNIAVLKDTANSIREVYAYNSKEMTVGDSLLYIRAIKKKDWESGMYSALQLSSIGKKDNIIFACRISKAGEKAGLTLENVKSNFALYEQE